MHVDVRDEPASSARQHRIQCVRAETALAWKRGPGFCRCLYPTRCARAGARTSPHRRNVAADQPETLVSLYCPRICVAVVCTVCVPVTNPDDPAADRLVILRHTLMNPWLIDRENGISYLERYFEFLARRM